jgi:Transcriptional activator of glycolytic enzymes
MDPLFCVLLHLGIYLEEYLGHHPNATYLFTEAEGERAPLNLKQTYRNRLERVVWKNQEFILLATDEEEEGVGTHSYRKFPSNYARGCGGQPDEIEIRGRWKSQGQKVVFRYIDVKQLTIDAKIAAILCVGGPIKYKFRGGVNITDDWLFTNVCPNIIRARFPNDARLCKVLAMAMLWCAMDAEAGEKFMSQGMRDRITQAYLLTHANVQQPIVKVSLNVYRIQDTLMIDEMPHHDGGGDAAAANPTPQQQQNPQQNQQQQAAVLINIQRLQQQQSQNHQQAMDSIAALRTWSHNQFKTVNGNIRAFGGTLPGALVRQDPQQRARRQQAEDPERVIEEEGTAPATLAPQPRTLQDCWMEYQHGIGGRKPAKDFTAAERGNRMNGIKQKYYRRKFIWLTIEKLMERGDTRQQAIKKIRDAYGWRCSVTQIINFIIHDHQPGTARSNGHGHPNLVDLSTCLRCGGRQTATV